MEFTHPKIEYRIVVKGWKVEEGQQREFTSCHYNGTQRSVEYERKRIGEELPDWHPHITEVQAECRQVTEWREVDTIPHETVGSSSLERKYDKVLKERNSARRAADIQARRAERLEHVIRELSSFDTIEPGPVQLPINEEHFRRLHGRRIKFRLRSPDGNIYRSGEGVLRCRKGGEGWETDDGFNTLSAATSLEWMTELEIL